MIKNIITILTLVCTSAYAQKSVLNNDSIKIKKILEEVVITGQIKEVNIDNALHDINIIGTHLENDFIDNFKANKHLHKISCSALSDHLHTCL